MGNAASSRVQPAPTAAAPIILAASDGAKARADTAAEAAAQAAQQAARAGDPSPQDTARLAARRLTLPVQGIAAHQPTDTYTDARANGVIEPDEFKRLTIKGNATAAAIMTLLAELQTMVTDPPVAQPIPFRGASSR